MRRHMRNVYVCCSMTFSDWTLDNLRWLVNNFPSSRFGTRKRVLGNECGRVARGYGNCWRLQWVPGEAHNMMEYALSILIVIFPYNSNKPRPQTESCVFSDVVRQSHPSGIFLPGTELLQSPFRTEFSKGSRSRRYRRSLRRHRRSLRRCRDPWGDRRSRGRRCGDADRCATR